MEPKKSLFSPLTSYSIGKGSDHERVLSVQEETLTTYAGSNLTTQTKPFKSVFATKKLSGPFPTLAHYPSHNGYVLRYFAYPLKSRVACLKTRSQ